MIPRLATLAVLALFAIPAGAQAKTFCVATTCAEQKNTIADAVKAASDNPGPDDVQIGPGVFDESISYAGNGPLTITGAGKGLTQIESAPKKEWVVDLERTTVSGLSVRAIDDGAGTGALRLVDSTAKQVRVKQESDERESVLLGDRSALEDSVVVGGLTFGGSVQAECPAGCAVRRTRIEANLALLATEGARVTAEDLVSLGAVGNTEGADLALSRALITPVAAIPIGIVTFGGTLDAKQTTIALRGVPAGGDSNGLLAIADSGQMLADPPPTVVKLDGVVIDGFTNAVRRAPESVVLRRSSTALPTIIARSSAWNRATEAIEPNQAGLDLQVIDLNGRGPGFKDPLAIDFGLRDGSALIDAVKGAAAAEFRDLDGKPAVDGNADGVVEADIGAFEGPARLRVEPPATPAAGPTAPVQASGPVLRAFLDAIKPRLSRARLVRGRLVVRLSENARLRITVSRRVKRSFKRVKTISVAAKAGDNRIRLALPRRRGAYRVAVVAKDLAGNESAQTRLALRVR